MAVLNMERSLKRLKPIRDPAILRRALAAMALRFQKCSKINLKIIPKWYCFANKLQNKFKILPFPLICCKKIGGWFRTMIFQNNQSADFHYGLVILNKRYPKTSTSSKLKKTFSLRNQNLL